MADNPAVLSVSETGRDSLQEAGPLSHLLEGGGREHYGRWTTVLRDHKRLTVVAERPQQPGSLRLELPERDYSTGNIDIFHVGTSAGVAHEPVARLNIDQKTDPEQVRGVVAAVGRAVALGCLGTEPPALSMEVTLFARRRPAPGTQPSGAPDAPPDQPMVPDGPRFARPAAHRQDVGLRAVAPVVGLSLSGRSPGLPKAEHSSGRPLEAV